MKEFYQKFVGLIYGIISIGFLIALWEYSAIMQWGHTNIFPPPSEFLKDLFDNDFRVGIGTNASTIGESIISSILRVIIGLSLGAFMAILVGTLISSSVWFRRLLLPIIRLLAPIAPIAWIPLALVLCGIGNGAAIFIVFMGVFFILVIATISAIDIVPQNLINSAKTLGVTSKFEIWRRIIFPCILPGVFTMLRINFLSAWMAVLAAEMTGLRDGLGAIIMTGRNLFNNELILLGMMLIGIVGFIFDIFLRYIQDRFLWRDKVASHRIKLNNNYK